MKNQNFAYKENIHFCFIEKTKTIVDHIYFPKSFPAFLHDFKKSVDTYYY